MHHPGPPRFVAVEEAVELAPRDPDPAATYEWTIERAPAESTATLGQKSVEWLIPDEPGRYVVALSAPDGVHRLTIRCFPGTDDGETSDSPGHSGHHSGTVIDTAGGTEDGTSGYAGTTTGSHSIGSGGRPRIRLDGVVRDEEVVVTADPRPHPGGTESAASLDVTFVVDDRDDLERTALRVDGRELGIPTAALPERARIHAVAVGEQGHSVADVIDVRRRDSTAGDDSSITVDRPYQPPAWAEDAVYYEVYVRTFAPEASHGETLSAITERLDHLANLGVDVIWLTPVLANDDAPHGYNITDFFDIAADLGDRADLEALVDAAHDRDMQVLFDLVLNHSARAHPHFEDAYQNVDSPYRDWYEWQESGEPGTYFDWELIANFDFASLDVRRHLLDAVDEWAPLVDGFRCDMAWAVPNGFWREVHDRVKARDADFLLLDETIPYIPDFQEGLFDVHFDSTTYATLRNVGTGWEPASAILDAIEQRAAVGFPDHAAFLLYAENHDETRYLIECGRPAALAAAGVLCTVPGAPLVYAGQELGQRGQRDDIVWEHTDEALTDHYRRLLETRRSMPALSATARLERVDYAVEAGEPDRVVAFARVADDGTVPTSDTQPADRSATGSPAEDATAAVVICNFDAESAAVTVEPSVGSVDAVTGESVRRGGRIQVEDVVVLPAERSLGRDTGA